MVVPLRTWLCLALTNILLDSVAHGTSFQPVPLDRLLVTTNAIVIGDYLGSESIVLENGVVATEAFFRLEKEWGIDAEDYGISEIKVYFPGGTVNGRSTVIDGAPRFVEGEKNILLLNQREDGRLWIQGLSMGTFKIVRIGQQSMVMNPVFPTNEELSQISLEQFLRKVTQAKSASLKEIHSDKYVRELSKDQHRMVAAESGAGRSIASVATAQKLEPNTLDSFWLVTLLTVFGGFVAFCRRGKAR